MKKLPLFILLQLIWIGLLIGGLSLYHKSPIKMKVKSGPIIIRIISGQPMNDSLVIIPANLDTVIVYRGDTIIWAIDSLSNVDSFKLALKKPTPDFGGSFPGLNYSKIAAGIIGPHAKLNKVYEYNIFWKMKNDTRQWVLDPKLSIKPNPGHPYTFNWIFYLSYALLALLSFGVFRKSKKEYT